jgi:hypothetical protein
VTNWFYVVVHRLIYLLVIQAFELISQNKLSFIPTFLLQYAPSNITRYLIRNYDMIIDKQFARRAASGRSSFVWRVPIVYRRSRAIIIRTRPPTVDDEHRVLRMRGLTGSGFDYLLDNNSSAYYANQIDAFP